MIGLTLSKRRLRLVASTGFLEQTATSNTSTQSSRMPIRKCWEQKTSSRSRASVPVATVSLADMLQVRRVYDESHPLS